MAIMVKPGKKKERPTGLRGREAHSLPSSTRRGNGEKRKKTEIICHFRLRKKKGRRGRQDPLGLPACLISATFSGGGGEKRESAANQRGDSSDQTVVMTYSTAKKGKEG